MEVIQNMFATFGAWNVNATISIWSFVTNNVTAILVIGIMGYMAAQDLKMRETDFIQDKRKLM